MVLCGMSNVLHGVHVTRQSCHMGVLSHSESAVIAWCDMMIVSQAPNISGVFVIAYGLIRWRTVR